MGAYFDLDRTLEPEMLKGLFETELHHCLARLIGEFHDPANNPVALVDRYRTHASTYDIAQRPGIVPERTDAHRDKLAKAGHDETPSNGWHATSTAIAGRIASTTKPWR